FSSRRRHTRSKRDWSSDVCSSDLYGSIDELNSFVGLAVSHLGEDLFEDILTDLEKIQNELFDCGTELSNVSKKERPHKLSEEIRSEERRVGKECRSQWSAGHERKK